MSNEEHYDEGVQPLLADGWEDCFVGFAQQFGSHGRQNIAVYDYEKMVDKLIKETSAQCKDDCDCDHYGEAVEYIDFNVLGAYVAPNMPAYIVIRPLAEAMEELEQLT